MKRTSRFFTFMPLVFVDSIAAIVLAACLGSHAAAAEGADLPIVFSEDFEQGADHWEPFDAKCWKLEAGKSGQGYSQFVKESGYKPPHRSPLNIALRKGDAVGDFTLECDVLSTTRDYNHRDACIVFGFQDAAHFYYVHLGKRADDHANQIFIVNDAPRTKISTTSTAGTDWKDDTWHHVKIERDAASGRIAIYFDDMEKPIMTATDKTFAQGRVGIGTFDDTAIYYNVRLKGR